MVASDDLTPLGGHGGHFATGPWESKDLGVSGTLSGSGSRPAPVLIILAVGSGCGSSTAKILGVYDPV